MALRGPVSPEAVAATEWEGHSDDTPLWDISPGKGDPGLGYQPYALSPRAGQPAGY